MIGVAVLYTTTEPKVVRNFLIACAIADIGHLYVTYSVMVSYLNSRAQWAHFGSHHLMQNSRLFSTKESATPLRINT